MANEVPALNYPITDMDDVFAQLDHKVRQCMSQAPSATLAAENRTNKWAQLAKSNDPRALWQAIDWNGKVCRDVNAANDAPSDDQFKEHFERLLNPPDSEPVVPPDPGGPYIPVTDAPITPAEILDAVNSMKPNKSGGPSGIPPGFLRSLPAAWIMFLATLFTTIFYTASFPRNWSLSRLIVIFKKGARSCCDNYRGISITDSFAKLFDAVLCRRLEKWYKPSREQAGAQKGRGCIEHIISLRLLMDYAVSTHRKLFIIYVDFSKAYDRVPRQALLRLLRRLGCGYLMVSALSYLYSDTGMILGSASVAATIGLRQGTPTSCLLFTIFLDEFVHDMKKLGSDGFLKWIHCFLLMDDTVIFSTNRERAIQKARVLTNFCSRSGMVINPDKTRFMVVNGEDQDRTPMVVSEDLTITNCSSYTYLGCIFTEDGLSESTVKQHLKSKQSHLLKFISFLTKNFDFPFWVKRKVLDAALLSTILYGCEVWLGNSVKAMTATYNASIRNLLGVRSTTATDLCLIEAGYPSLEARVKNIQRKVVQKLLMDPARSRQDDPFLAIWHLCKEEKTKGYKYYERVLNNEHILTDLHQRQTRIRQHQGTKFITYRTFNESLTDHGVYAATNISEHHRVAFTRLRLSSHRLAIETGRWSRLPRERRLCACGAVQTEEHVVCSCPTTAHIRDTHAQCNYRTIKDFFISDDLKEMCEAAYACLNAF